MIQDREGGWHVEGGDELINDDMEAGLDQVTVTGLPPRLEATIQFGYDHGLESWLAARNKNFDSWIANVFPHAQAHFRHKESLGTEIEFKVSIT